MDSGATSGLLATQPLIHWLPDETIYSLASRFHALSGQSRARSTAKALFGRPQGGFPHDLPAGISHFSRVFAGALGSGEEIVSSHSVLPFFLTFRNAEERRDAAAALSGDRIGSLKMRLGLPASRLGAMCSLKACRDCMLDDTQAHGTPYWHRDHQLPGIWVCPEHGCPLCVAIGKRAGEDRFGWELPNRPDLEMVVDQKRASDRSWTSLERLASLIMGAVHSPGELEGVNVSAAILGRMAENGLVGPSGKLRAERATAEFQESINPLRASNELHALSVTDGGAYGMVRHALHSPQKGHALRHFLVLFWLFDSWQHFRDCYDSVDVSHEEAAHAVPPSLEHPALAAVLRLVEGGMSISAAASAAGVAVATAQTWVASRGLAVPRRPSKLNSANLVTLIGDLEGGSDVATAAARAGVTTSSVNRILRTHPGVLARRRATLLEASRMRERQAWVSACGSVAGIALARKLQPGSYAWLYRNDREWLLQESSPDPKRRNGPRLDWQARDEQLSESIVRAAAVIAEDRSLRRITIASLARLVPELKAKLDVLDRLPQTAKVLNDLLGREISVKGLFDG
jgi:transposase